MHFRRFALWVESTHGPAFVAGMLVILLTSCATGDEPDARQFQGVSEKQLLNAKGDWGGFRGQIVFDGPVPEPKLLFEKGSNVKDRDICASVDRYDTSLLVDEQTKGIANCIIYCRRWHRPVHPLLQEPKKKVVMQEIKNCQFVPRIVVCRENQELEIVNRDRTAHIPHSYAARNHAIGAIVSPNASPGTGLKIRHLQTEAIPFSVKCDYHPHMQTWWHVVDSPYYAVTDSAGRFRIVGLPAGTYTFCVWHERAGLIEPEPEVIVKDGEVTALPVLSVTGDRFEGTASP